MVPCTTPCFNYGAQNLTTHAAEIPRHEGMDDGPMRSVGIDQDAYEMADADEVNEGSNI